MPVRQVDFGGGEGLVTTVRGPKVVDFSEEEGLVITSSRRPKRIQTPRAGATPSVGAERGPGGIPTPSQDPDSWDTLLVFKRPAPGIARVSGTGLQRRVHKAEAAGTNGADVKDLGKKAREVTISLLLWEDAHWRALEKLLPRLMPQKPPPRPEDFNYTWGTRSQGEGLLFDTNDSRENSPMPLSNERRAEQGEGLFSPFGRTVINSPMQTREQAEARAQQAAAKAAAELAKPVDVEHPTLRLFGIKALHFLEVGMPEEVGEGTQLYSISFRCVDYIAPGNKPAAVGTAQGAAGGWDAIQSAITARPPGPSSVAP